jgi:hypothetical protein
MIRNTEKALREEQQSWVVQRSALVASTLKDYGLALLSNKAARQLEIRDEDDRRLLARLSLDDLVGKSDQYRIRAIEDLCERAVRALESGET